MPEGRQITRSRSASSTPRNTRSTSPPTGWQLFSSKSSSRSSRPQNMQAFPSSIRPAGRRVYSRRGSKPAATFSGSNWTRKRPNTRATLSVRRTCAPATFSSIGICFESSPSSSRIRPTASGGLRRTRASFGPAKPPAACSKVSRRHSISAPAPLPGAGTWWRSSRRRALRT